MSYPKILVTMQFVAIIFILLLSKGFFSSLIYPTIFIIGAIVGILAISSNRIGNFNIQPKIKDGAQLITSGIYRYIRHPMYFSVIVMMLPFTLATNRFLNWLLFALLIVVLYLKAIREESLWSNTSKEYIKYKEKTKAIVPFLF